MKNSLITNNHSVSVVAGARRLAMGCATIVMLTAGAPSAAAAVHRLSPTEMKLFKAISRSDVQERRAMKLDPILCKVARKRAKDMAKHSYFSHTDPSGQGPNRLVRLAGYVLPLWYDMTRAGNNIESIAMTGGDAAGAVAMWKDSPPHRVHVFGTIPFYREQESIGVGAFTTGGYPSRTYYVFLSAPKNESKRMPSFTLMNPAGRTVSNTP